MFFARFAPVLGYICHIKLDKIMSWLLKTLSTFLLFLCPFLVQAKIFVVGSAENLFSQLLKQENEAYVLVADLDEALSLAGKGNGIIVTAPEYPVARAEISKEAYSAAKRRGVRLFVEYPAILPSGDPSVTYKAGLERGVVTSKEVGLEEMSIVGINGCALVRAECRNPLIVLAKVAGYDTAVFGLADTDTYPLLYKEGACLISTTSFSSCIIGRYGPADSWRKIISYVLGWVLNDDDFELSSLPVDPMPAYSKDEVLPEDARRNAVISAADWFWNARLFIHPSWEKELMRKYQTADGNINRYFGEPITESHLPGDGCRGIMEGHASSVNEVGVQQYRYFIRADVHGESAMLLASAGALTGESKYTEASEKLLDYLFYTSDFRDGERGNPASPAYGLISWANSNPGTFYADDNARCVLGAIGAAAMMDNPRWNRFIVENILANLRLSGEMGFIGSRHEQHDVIAKGWQWYADRTDFVNPSPHFESWMWACYLWLYGKTGYRPLYDKAVKGISHMMEIYPDWRAQNGIQQERARMILPLAWLVRVDDTPQHREWLDIVVRRFLQNQVECGAVRDELASAERQTLHISSNALYGSGEAPLIAKNGDPVSDLLYTCNFGFFALNEAYRATGCYGDEVRKLADFLARIQVRSELHNDVDGAWFRAFDYDRWDYWASNADDGWGAWCTLCGWIQSWIGVTEGLVGNGTSYWDITAGLDMKKSMENSLWMMER